MRSIQEGSFKNKKVLIRVDFNVPLTKEGTIADDRRIRNSLATIQKVTQEGGIALLLTHFGRPKQGYDPALSLQFLVPALTALLQQPVHFAPTCVGPETEELIAGLEAGSVVLLENIRFFSEETANDPLFAQSLAGLADAYVNEAFGTIHRDHVSTVLVPTYFSERFAGCALQAECAAIDRLFAQKTAPTVAVMGGNKGLDKAKSIQGLVGYAQHILVGGRLAHALYETQRTAGASEASTAAAFPFASFQTDHPGTVISLPEDLVTAPAATGAPSDRVVSSWADMPEGHAAFDIGPQTQTFFAQRIAAAKTIFWAGPMGAFETKPFDAGTYSVAQAIVRATERGAYSIVGGGDTAAALTHMGYANRVSHLSTGGGALLAYVAANGALRSLEVLKR